MKTKTIKVTKAEADKLMMLLNRNTCELQNKVEESTDVCTTRFYKKQQEENRSLWARLYDIRGYKVP